MITSWKTPALLIETLVPLHLPNAQAVLSMSPKLCMHIYTSYLLLGKPLAEEEEEEEEEEFNLLIYSSILISGRRRRDCQALSNQRQ